MVQKFNTELDPLAAVHEKSLEDRVDCSSDLVGELPESISIVEATKPVFSTMIRKMWWRCKAIVLITSSAMARQGLYRGISWCENKMRCKSKTWAGLHVARHL
jgi:hypothetical protein